MQSYELRLAPGTYPPILLAPEDSGTALSPLIITGASDATVVSGGLVVPVSLFSASKSNPKLVTADLSQIIDPSTLGTMVTGSPVDDCQHNLTTLYHNGQQMLLGRYPNVNASTGQWEFIHAASGGTNELTVTSSSNPGTYNTISLLT